MAPTTLITKVKPSLCNDDGRDAGALAGATLAAKRQKKAIKTRGYKVSNNLAPPPKQVLRSMLPGGNVAGGSPMKAAILSQEEDAVEDGTDGKEPSNEVESWGDDPDARADEVEYNNNVDARGGGSGLRHAMAKLKAAMTKPGSMAAWFAEQVGLTTVTKMAATYEGMVRSMVEDPAGAFAVALAPEAKERTYLAVPNKEGVFSVFHGLTWWADAPGGVCNQQGNLVAFKGNICSGRGVPNLWRFDEPDEQLFRLVKLPPVALRDVARFYASDDNDDYYRDTIVPDKGGAGWKPMCGHLIPIPGEWAALFLDYPDLGTTFRRIVDLINLVDEAKRVKFQHLVQSVAYACLSASKSARPMSTMASKWKRLIFTKPTLDWAQLAWSGQVKSAEATNGVATTTLAMSPANDFASIFGGSARWPVRIPITQTRHGERAPPGVDPAPTNPPVTYRATGAGPPGLNVETLIQTLFEAQAKAQVVLAAGQNANLIAFHTATAQALASKSGEKDSKLTVAKKAILQACCGQADSTTFVAPTIYLDMEVEGGTAEAIG
jgi:hypothetical protein